MRRQRERGRRREASSPAMSFDARLVGERLRRAREAAGLSRSSLVSAVRREGVRLSLQGLRDFETGRRASLTPLLFAAQAVGLTPAELFGSPPAPGDPLGEVERLARLDGQFAPLERELLLAVTGRIRDLRGERPAAPRAVPAARPEGAMRRGALRAHLLDLLAEGGAYGLREIRARARFSEVGDTDLQRALTDLRREGVVATVGLRPIRYFLTAPPVAQPPPG